MTGEWENALGKIAAGEMNADEFHRGIEVHTTQIVIELLEAKIASNDFVSWQCPKCKTGQALLYPAVVRCNNPDCDLVIFRKKAQKTLSEKQVGELLLTGKTSTIKGFHSNSSGKDFDAVVAFDKDFNTIFEFPKKSKPKPKAYSNK